MEIVKGVFKTRTEAERAIDELRALGIPGKHIGFLTPGASEKEVEGRLPLTDSEGPGTGRAMGAAVGGAMGAAGGATLGAAAASLAVPGVGPVIAIGLVAATLLGVGGAFTGGLAGEAIEEALGEGLPHEELYVYEEALRRGNSVVVAFAEDLVQAERAGKVMERNHSLDIEELRESWWTNIRSPEQADYQQTGRDFKHDEVSYRRGFQAALHPSRRGKSYAEAEVDLRKAYDDSELDTGFRHGYERGRRYQARTIEIHEV